MANFQLINDLLKRRKITKKDFCNDIGLTDTALRQLIDRNSTKTEIIERIAHALNVPVGFFFDEVKDSTKTNAKNNISGNNFHGTNNIQVDVNLADCKAELERLQVENEHLKAIIEEKERTIQILLTK